MNRRTLCGVLLLALLVPALALFAETYRGNTRSRVFHAPSCQHYTCKHCTTTFPSAAEAIERGYHPCGTCRPADSAKNRVKGESEEAYAANTKTRNFHRGSCRYASCKNCTASFKTRQAAIDAGYVPGGCCRP